MKVFKFNFIAKHVSNVITFILRSRRLYVGVLFCNVYALASCLLVSVYLWVHRCVMCYYNVLWICSIVIYKSYHIPISVCIGV